MTDRAPIAFLRGDDAWAIERAIDSFTERLSADAAGPVERWRTSGDGTSPVAILERVATAPLFGGGTAAIVTDPGPLLRSNDNRDAMIALLGSVAPGNGLVFVELGSDPKMQTAALTALGKAIEAAGGTVRTLEAPREGGLAAWIDRRADELGVRLGPGAAKELATRVGGFVREGDIDRRRQGQFAVGELEKLALYRPATEVSVADVQALVPEAIPGSIWAFVDAVGMRLVPRATELLDRLLGTTPEPVLVAVLHRRLRELVEIVDRLESGEEPKSLPKAMKLHPYRADQLIRQAGAWSAAELAAAIDGLVIVDATVKGAPGMAGGDAKRRLAFTLWLADAVSPTLRTAAPVG